MGSCFGRYSQEREEYYGEDTIDFPKLPTGISMPRMGDEDFRMPKPRRNRFNDSLGNDPDTRLQEDLSMVQSKPKKSKNSNRKLPSETDAYPIPRRNNSDDGLGYEPHSWGITQEGEEDDAYPMTNNPHGICIIIANEHFSAGLGQRKGNEHDVNRLKELFRKLDFIVEIKKDCTALEIRTHLKSVKKRLVTNMDCFICVICSHGNAKGVLGTDGVTVSREKIKELFDGSHCVALVGKPKLFFFQACAGGNIDTPAGKIVRDGPGAIESENIPSKADMYTASASYPGYVSMRHERKGSWFIQTLVNVVDRISHEDIYKIMTKVTSIVCKKHADFGDSKRSMQCVHTESTLQKFFYFK